MLLAFFFSHERYFSGQSVRRKRVKWTCSEMCVCVCIIAKMSSNVTVCSIPKCEMSQIIPCFKDLEIPRMTITNHLPCKMCEA